MPAASAHGEKRQMVHSKKQIRFGFGGTAVRSDGEAAVWLPLNSRGAICLPEEAVYRLTYGKAVDLEYCRPASFHNHRAEFTVDLEDGDSISVSSHCTRSFLLLCKNIESLRRALEYDKLIRIVERLPDGSVDLNSYQAIC